MEQTIGKRIMTLRKSRNMTQDQLAEQVGVSAQAVSKWENGISCPDISLLPRLAEIFQVTTDHLLGMPEKTEIVPAAPKQNSFHINLGETEEEEDDAQSLGGFTLNFDIGKKDLPWFATAVLVFAVSLLMNRTLLSGLGEAGIWDLLWPSALLAWGLSGLWHTISVWSVGLTVFGVYSLLVQMHLVDWLPWLKWHYVLPILLVLWALSMLGNHFHGQNHHGKRASVSTFLTQDGMLNIDASFVSETIQVPDQPFRGGLIDLSFASYTLDFTDCKTVEPDAVLTCDVSFGSLELLLPRNWRLQDTADQSFSSRTLHGAPAPDADQVLTVNSDLSFSTLSIRWEA